LHAGASDRLSGVCPLTINAYGVSLDNDAAKWRTFVADNDMPWINVLGVNADKRSDAAAMYGISSIPANFLISPKGIIVARDLRGENIKARLEEAPVTF